jgi:hypothetical protein
LKDIDEDNIKIEADWNFPKTYTAFYSKENFFIKAEKEKN